MHEADSMSMLDHCLFSIEFLRNPHRLNKTKATISIGIRVL